MPGVFDIPVTKPIWDKVTVDPLAASDSLPPQFQQLKANITESYRRINEAKLEKERYENRVFYQNSLTAEQKEALKIAKADLDRWSKSEQYLFDTNVEKMYLSSLDRSDPTYFTSWYLAQLKQQIEEMKNKMQEAFLKVLVFLSRENAIKTTLKDYQYSVIQTQKEWLNFLEKQIHEQLKLISDLQNVSNTEGRRSQFILKDVVDYNTLTFWVKTFFWTLIIVLILYMIYLRFGEYLKLKAEAAARAIAEKAPASVKQAISNVQGNTGV